MTETYNCNKCNKSFKYFSYLERHQQSKRDCRLDTITDDGKYCPDCKRNFATPYTYTRHFVTCKGRIQNDNVQNNLNNNLNNNQNNNTNNNNNNIQNNQVGQNNIQGNVEVNIQPENLVRQIHNNIEINNDEQLINNKSFIDYKLIEYIIDLVKTKQIDYKSALKYIKDLLLDSDNNSRAVVNPPTVNNNHDNHDNHNEHINNGEINNGEINNNNFSHNNINMNISFINPFGYETINHLTDDQKLDILKSPIALEKIVRSIYSVPQNRNFIRPNSKREYINVLDCNLDISNCNIDQFYEQVPANCLEIMDRIFFSIHDKLSFMDKQSIQANINRQRDNIGLEVSIVNLKNLLEDNLQNTYSRDCFKRLVDTLRRNQFLKDQKLQIVNNLISDIQRYKNQKNYKTLSDQTIRTDIWKIEEKRSPDTNINNYRNDLRNNYIENTPRYKFFKERAEEEQQYFDEHGIPFGDIEQYYNILINRATRELEIISEQYEELKKDNEEHYDSIITNATEQLVNKPKSDHINKLQQVSFENFNNAIQL